MRSILRSRIHTASQGLSSWDAVIAESGMEVASFAAPRDGIVAFSTDGYEGLTKDSFTAEHFDLTEYENTLLADQMKVSAGDPVYRMITSENWTVIVPSG